MNIGKLHIGFWRNVDGKLYKPVVWLEYRHDACGCYMFTVANLCVTWLMFECWEAERRKRFKMTRWFCMWCGHKVSKNKLYCTAKCADKYQSHFMKIDD